MLQTGCNGLGLVAGTFFHEHRFVPLNGTEVGQNPGQWPKEKDDDDDDEKLNLKKYYIS